MQSWTWVLENVEDYAENIYCVKTAGTCCNGRQSLATHWLIWSTSLSTFKGSNRIVYIQTTGQVDGSLFIPHTTIA